jgi:hypothetical protein
MGEPYMTWTEIQKKYPKEWVYINNPTSRGPSHPVTGGVVVLHTADHAEFIRRVFDFPEVVHGAILYTGPRDNDNEIIET